MFLEFDEELQTIFFNITKHESLNFKFKIYRKISCQKSFSFPLCKKIENSGKWWDFLNPHRAKKKKDGIGCRDKSYKKHKKIRRTSAVKAKVFHDMKKRMPKVGSIKRHQNTTKCGHAEKWHTWRELSQCPPLYLA